MRPWHSVLLFLLLAGFVGPASAEDKKSVEVEIWAVRATTKNKEISKELRESKELHELVKVLKKQFKYTGFKLEKKIPRKKVELNKPWKVNLIGDYKVAFTPKARESKRIKYELVVTKRVKKKDKPVLKTTVTSKSGPWVPYGCGSLKGGDYLIMLVRVR